MLVSRFEAFLFVNVFLCSSQFTLLLNMWFKNSYYFTFTGIYTDPKTKNSVMEARMSKTWQTKKAVTWEQGKRVRISITTGTFSQTCSIIHKQEQLKNNLTVAFSLYSLCRWYNMGHNSGDSIGGNHGPPAGSGAMNKRHRGSPRNTVKNPAGQLRSNSAETQMHSKPRLVKESNCTVMFVYIL